MSQSGISPKSRIFIPCVIALIASLIAVAAFFLPYISATEEYGNYLESQGDQQALEAVDMTYRDIKNLSLFEYAKAYFQGGSEIMRSETDSIFYGVLISSVGILSLLVLLAVLGKKPILTIILTVLLGGLCYIIHWDFVDRGIMPDSNRVWGFAYYMLYACVAFIILSAIWMFIEKRRMKKAAKIASA